MFFYNRLVENVILPVGDRILGTSFMEGLRSWRSIQWASSDELSEVETDRLRRLLTHATQNVKFYQKFNSGHDSLDPERWLKMFPVIHKRDIKDHIDDFVFGSREDLVREVSSGSSGIQGEVYMSKKESSSVQAAQTLLWEWAGYRLGSPMLQLGMTTNRGWVKTIKDIVLRTNYQQAFDLNPVEVNSVLTSIGKRTHFFGGYASGLYAYSEMAKTCPQFKAVISWGDKMFAHYRKSIEERFGAKVFDTYGSTEGLVIAGQCEQGSYHVLSPHVKLELLDADGNEVEDGELGYVVVTRLDGFAMPLIRYYLGDMAIKEDSGRKCECGRYLPMLKQIVGRDTDVVKTRSGKVLIVHFFTGILEHFPAVKQFQIVQNDLDGFTINYIPEPAIFDFNVLEKIETVIQEKAKEKIKIAFNEVSTIAPTKSGKPQIIKSLL